MTEYHPPMTGLEAHFEEELDPKGRSEYSKVERDLRAADTAPKPSRENKDDKVAEEAMHLGQ